MLNRRTFLAAISAAAMGAVANLYALGAAVPRVLPAVSIYEWNCGWTIIHSKNLGRLVLPRCHLTGMARDEAAPGRASYAMRNLTEWGVDRTAEVATGMGYLA